MFRMVLSTLRVGLGLAALASVAAVAGPATAQTTVRFAYGGFRDSQAFGTTQWGVASDVFRERVKACSQGRYVVQEFPGAQLGGERELLEGVQIGTIDVMMTTSGPLGNFVRETEILDIPYLFRDAQHAYAVLDGPIGQELLDKLTARGLVGLAWGENGFRHVSNNVRPVRSVADLKGIKVRVAENKTHITAFKALGALPTPMAWPIYTHLQQGAVDGQENPLSIIVAARLHEVQKYVTETAHVYSPVTFIASPVLWPTLPADDKRCFIEAARTGGAAMRERSQELENAARKILRNAGVQVLEQFDRTGLEDRLALAYAVYNEQFGKANIDRIRSFKAQ